MTQLTLLEQSYTKVLAFLKQVRSVGRTSTLEWQEFEKNLAPLPSAAIRSVSVWTMENLEHHRAELVRPRVLHESESAFVDAAAHGILLDALRLGMISPSQGENILEELVEFEQVQVYPELMLETVSRVWSHNIRNYQKIQLN